MIVRASDVPTYVAHGAADIGVAGKDVLLEQGGEGLYQPLDLEIARCRMVVATQARIRLGRHRPARRAHSRRHQVRADGARALRRQGRARRSDQAVRLDGAGAAVRSRRCDRRPRELRAHARRQRSRRRRGYRSDQRPARRQSRGAQAQARSSCSRCWKRWRRRWRQRGAQSHERGTKRRREAGERRNAGGAPPRCVRAGLRARALRAHGVRSGAGPRGGRDRRANRRRRARARRRRTPRIHAPIRRRRGDFGGRARNPGGSDARRLRRAAGADARRPANRRVAHPRFSRAAEARVVVVSRRRRQRIRPAGERARPRRHLRAGRQGRVPVVGADERDPGARRGRRRNRHGGS